MEVDHFDPRLKNDYIQTYENLFPASKHVNGKKWKHWPNREESKAGARFLNPCLEVDYGEQIFEDTNSHILIGINPAARWHIRICGLNADRLVQERKKRTRFIRELKQTPVLFKKDGTNIDQLITSFSSEVSLMIPEIPPPPAL